MIYAEQEPYHRMVHEYIFVDSPQGGRLWKQ